MQKTKDWSLICMSLSFGREGAGRSAALAATLSAMNFPGIDLLGAALA
jgi:hypothetical protein